MTDRKVAGMPEADALPPDYFAQLVDVADHGIYCIDVDGNATYLNPAAEALLGFAKRDLLGAPMHATIHRTDLNGQPHPKEDCAIHRAIRDGATRRGSGDLFWRANGTSFPVEYVSTPLRRGTTVIGAVISFQDISGRQREAEERLQAVRDEAARAEMAAADARRLYAEAQDSIRSRDEFLSIAAHELRTPATALRGFAQLALRRLKRGAFDAERGRRVLEEIERQTVNLNTLVNQLLEASRLDIGTLVINREPMDIVASVTAAVRAVQANTAAHTLVVRAPESLPAFLDAARTEEVLVNIFDCAVQFSPDGGLIEVDVSTPLPNTGQVVVRDHGVGLPAEHRDHLFDRFSQAQNGDHYWSLGLGLSLGRQITELQGGALTVDAPSGGGTRFTLLLPLQLPATVSEPLTIVHGRSLPGAAGATLPEAHGAPSKVG